MTPGSRFAAVVEFEPFGASVGCALVSGAFSVIAPFLLALTGTLAALALAGWVCLVRRRGPVVPQVARPYRGVALLIWGAGAVVFVVSPLGLAPFRGLVLATSVLPLWTIERSRSLGGLPGSEAT